MSTLGRYFSPRDIRLQYSINRELLKDIVQCVIIIYKISADLANINLYGEDDTKTYYPGVQLVTLIDHPDTSTENEDFGPDKIKQMQFRFQEDICKEANLYPEIGDHVEWDNSYYEIHNVIQEQHLGGQTSKSWSIICDAHLSRNSKLNIIQRQS